MSINRGKVVNVSKLYAAIFIICATLITDVLFNKYVQDSKRQQARFNVEHTVGCLGLYESIDESRVVDPLGMKLCASKMRTSPTGDMYLLDMADLKFVYDNSSDVPRDMYFTKESVGQYFNEWDTAIGALGSLTNGTDSVYGTRAKYNYDGATEWLEFGTYTTKDGRNLVVVQGVQSDEVLRAYKLPKVSIGILVLSYVMWLIATSTCSRRKRKPDDC